MVKTVTLDEVKAFFRNQKKTVLTFTGYSGSGYEDTTAMLVQAESILDEFDPQITIVNIGATVDGIGAVYVVAKQKGFITTGIVSIQAQKYNARISSGVDHVFFINDDTWGGLLPQSGKLAPTSEAIVRVSDIVVGIGGGEATRDELIAAQALGKKVRFYAADMNHRQARDKAAKKGLPAPADFSGAAAAALQPDRIIRA